MHCVKGQRMKLFLICLTWIHGAQLNKPKCITRNDQTKKGGYAVQRQFGNARLYIYIYIYDSGGTLYAHGLDIAAMKTREHNLRYFPNIVLYLILE